MAKAAWDAVHPSTIANCWTHTQIQPPITTSSTADTIPNTNPSGPTPTETPHLQHDIRVEDAWNIVRWERKTSEFGGNPNERGGGNAKLYCWRTGKDWNKLSTSDD